MVTIAFNPSNSPCNAIAVIDNILLTPLGPNAKITTNGNPDAWITSTCFQGNIPVIMHGSLDSVYNRFDSSGYVRATFTNPAVQWQQSTDNGYTWTDISGATNLNFSHVFSIPDTFFVRMRVSEAADIGNRNCSVASNVILVQVDGLPGNISVSSNSPACTDGDLVFDLQGGASYTLTGPNGFFDNSPFPHIFHPKVSDSGWYVAQVLTPGGCFVTDSVYAIIAGPDITVSRDTAVCYGKAVALQATGGNHYTWSPATGLSAADIPNPVATPTATTRYTVQVTDNSGCAAQATVTVSLKNNLLKAGFVSPPVACPQNNAVFTDTSVGQITAWNWNFGNGQTSNSARPPSQFYPQGPGEPRYTVQLTVTDSTGCTSSATAVIKAASNCLLAVPTAFTPNSDGLNDYLYPLNAFNAVNLVFRVFNRYGKLIFETTNPANKWDGTLNGTPQESGAYIWTLQYTGEDNKPISMKGSAVLVR